MNHPFGSCYNHFQKVANLFEDLQRYKAHNHQSLRPSLMSPPPSDDGNNTIQPTNQEPIDVDLNLPTAVDDGPFVDRIHHGFASHHDVMVTGGVGAGAGSGLCTLAHTVTRSHG